ncbi:MAG: hypothetical protein AAB473_02140 [Patescibacteria group bacterium]
MLLAVFLVCAAISIGSPWLAIPAAIFWIVALLQRIHWANLAILWGTGSVLTFFIQPFSTGSVLAVVLIISAIVAKQPAQIHSATKKAHKAISLDEWLTGGIALFSSGTVLFLATLSRNGDTLRSVWQIANPSWFVLFALSLIATVSLGTQKSRLTPYALILLSFTAFGIALLVFGNGFGFDPFLHRGAIGELIIHHHLEPIRILYSGYYGLIATLSTLFAVPYKIIDLLLVPVIASAIPYALYTQIGKHENGKVATYGAVALFAIPYAYLTFSVPFSVTAITTILTVFFFNSWKDDGEKTLQTVVMNILAVFFHPLIAIPTLFWTIGVMMQKSLPRLRIHIGILSGVLIALGIPGMLAFHNYQSGSTPFLVAFPWENFTRFTDLFRDPYVDASAIIPTELSLFYAYFFFITPLIGVSAMLLPFFSRSNREKAWIYSPLFLGLFFGALLIATNLEFKDVISYEQREFCFRILHVLWILPLPLAAQILAQKTFHRTATFIVGALLATHISVMWFFSYQQYNAKNPGAGPSVSTEDYEALAMIKNIMPNETPLVLGNQMISAAAIEQYGFGQTTCFDGMPVLQFPIPTGGVLYPWFLAMNEVPSRKLLREIATHTDNDTMIFVVHQYWPNANAILKRASLFAEAIYETSSKGITLLVYKIPHPSASCLLH